MGDEERISSLESRIEVLEARLRQLETSRPPPFNIATPPAAPPLIIPPPVRRPFAEPQPQYNPPPVRAATVPQADPVSRPNADTEYLLGAKWLPRIGAVVFLTGVLFLVSWAINRGYITARVQYAGELLLCGAFIIAGLVKRNEKEAFGQILVGIGSCGLYFSFAGADVYKHLISDNALVLLFMGLSFANLAFSWWRSSRSFLAIGLIGGLAGALMPLQQNNVAINGYLQLSIIAAVSLIIARNRWLEIGIGLLLIAVGAVCPGLFLVPGDPWLKLAFLYGNALLALGAIGISTRSTDWDPDQVVLPLAGFGVGVLGLNFMAGRPACLHTAVFAGVVAVLAMLLSGKQVSRDRLLAGSAAILLLLTPAGLYKDALPVYAALSLALAIFMYCRFSKLVLFFAWTELAFTLGAYFYAEVWTLPWRQELVIELFAGAAGFAVGYASYRRAKLGREAAALVRTFTGAVAAAALLRAFFLVGIRMDPLARPEVTQLVGGLALAYGLVVTAFFRRSSFWVGSSWALLGYAGASYLMLASANRLTVTEDISFLVAAMALILVLHNRMLKLGTSADLSLTISCMAAYGLVMRGAYVGFVPVDLRHREAFVMMWTALMLLAGFGVLELLTKRRIGTIFGWMAALAVGCCYLELYSVGQIAELEEVMILPLLMGGALFLSHFTPKPGESRNFTRATSAILIWAMFSRLGFILLTSQAVNMMDTAAVTLSWTVYAVILITLGFIREIPILRYLSLTLFAITLGKVFMVDLAALDSGIRVMVLLALGLAMIGGGYWYIRARMKTQLKI